MSCTSRHIEDVDHDYTNIKLTINVPVKKHKPNFLIFPVECPSSPKTAVIFPFKILQEIPHNKKYLSFELTKILYSSFLKHWVFTKLIMENTFVDSLDKAVNIAKKENCDLVIIPYINYIFFGGSSGPTIISTKIDIFRVQDKQLLWSITQLGRVEPIEDRDYIFLKTHYKIPHFVESIIISELAKDISTPIKLWNYQDCTNYYKSINFKIKTNN